MLDERERKSLRLMKNLLKTLSRTLGNYIILISEQMTKMLSKSQN